LREVKQSWKVFLGLHYLKKGKGGQQMSQKPRPALQDSAKSLSRDKKNPIENFRQKGWEMGGVHHEKGTT